MDAAGLRELLERHAQGAASEVHPALRLSVSVAMMQDDHACWLWGRVGYCFGSAGERAAATRAVRSLRERLERRNRLEIDGVASGEGLIGLNVAVRLPEDDSPQGGEE